MHRQGLRAVLTTALSLVVVGVLVVGITVKLRANQSTRAESELLTIAHAVQLPPGSRPFTQADGSCFTSSYVQCALSDLDADVAAQQMQALLSVAADEEAGLDCETGVSARVRSRMCTIRIDRARRVLIVSVTSKLRQEDGKIVIDGAEIRITKP